MRHRPGLGAERALQRKRHVLPALLVRTNDRDGEQIQYGTSRCFLSGLHFNTPSGVRHNSIPRSAKDPYPHLIGEVKFELVGEKRD